MSLTRIDRNPTAINILKLQRYNFDYFTLEEVVFFEYMVVKGRAFGFKQFYHSHITIAREIGIKKAKLNTILGRFRELGIIETEVKGLPPVHNYKLNYEKIIELLPNIYRVAENEQLVAGFGKLLADFFQSLAEMSEQKNSIKNINKELLKENKANDSDKSEGIIEEKNKSTKNLIKKMNIIYNNCRESFDEDNESDEIYPEVNLVINESIKQIITTCLTVKNELDITNAFTAYVDAVLNSELTVKKLLPYFFHQVEGNYVIIDHYGEKYNSDYLEDRYIHFRDY